MGETLKGETMSLCLCVCFVFSWDRTWCNLDLFLSVLFSLGVLVPPASMREMKGDSSDRHSRRLPMRLSSGQSKLAGEES